MPPYFQAEPARRLSGTGLFASVVSLGEAPLPTGPERALRIECTMTRLAPGSVAARFFIPGAAGRTKAEVEVRFVDVQTDTVVMVTADRRAGQRADTGEFGLESEGILRESFDAMARDLAKFLVRLSRSEAPRK